MLDRKSLQVDLIFTRFLSSNWKVKLLLGNTVTASTMQFTQCPLSDNIANITHSLHSPKYLYITAVGHLYRQTNQSQRIYNSSSISARLKNTLKTFLQCSTFMLNL